MDDHPVRITVDDDLRRSRLTVFFRLLLAIPHFIWFVLWSIAVVFAAIATWVAALVRGAAPDGLHNFLAAYVRYSTHLSAYLALAANPYPGFTGEPGYPLDVEIPGPQPQARWKIALRLFLAVPALFIATVVGWGFHAAGGGASQSGDTTEAEFFVSIGGAVGACAFLGWFASLALGRMPNGLRDLAAYGVGYNARAGAYALLLTDRYPNSDPEAIGPGWSMPPHPVQLELDDDGRRSRLTVAFRLLLALPHLVWLALWSLAAVLAAFANWLVALVRGRSAEPLHRFLAAYIRYSVHVSAFLFLVGQPVPRLRRRARLPRRRRDCAARAAEPVDHVLPDVARRCRRSSSRAHSRAPCSPRPSSAGSRRSPPAGCRQGSATSVRCRSAIRRRRTPTGSSSTTGIRTRARLSGLPSSATSSPSPSLSRRQWAEPPHGAAGARRARARRALGGRRHFALAEPGAGRPRPADGRPHRAHRPGGDRPRRAVRDASSGSSSSSPSSC